MPEVLIYLEINRLHNTISLMFDKTNVIIILYNVKNILQKVKIKKPKYQTSAFKNIYFILINSERNRFLYRR